MKFLLCSSGISNPSIHDALVGLLGKPIGESSALCIPTGIQPFPGGPSAFAGAFAAAADRASAGRSAASRGRDAAAPARPGAAATA